MKGGVYEVGFQGQGFCFDNELSAHEVHLRDFQIHDALVTNLEYLEFINDGGYKRHELWHDEGWAWVNQDGVKSPLHWHSEEDSWKVFTLTGLVELAGDAPVTHISHYEAAAFAAWKGLRLPSEFEWEVASDELRWGDRWEHTASPYVAYPGFRKADGAVGEDNGKFMMNQMVLRGASTATPEGHSRKTYRNFFHPNMQWQFTGIRLAKDG